VSLGVSRRVGACARARRPLHDWDVRGAWDSRGQPSDRAEPLPRGRRAGAGRPPAARPCRDLRHPLQSMITSRRAVVQMSISDTTPACVSRRSQWAEPLPGGGRGSWPPGSGRWPPSTGSGRQVPVAGAVRAARGRVVMRASRTHRRAVLRIAAGWRDQRRARSRRVPCVTQPSAAVLRTTAGWRDGGPARSLADACATRASAGRGRVARPIPAVSGCRAPGSPRRNGARRRGCPRRCSRRPWPASSPTAASGRPGRPCGRSGSRGPAAPRSCARSCR